AVADCTTSSFVNLREGINEGAGQAVTTSPEAGADAGCHRKHHHGDKARKGSDGQEREDEDDDDDDDCDDRDCEHCRTRRRDGDAPKIDGGSDAATGAPPDDEDVGQRMAILALEMAKCTRRASTCEQRFECTRGLYIPAQIVGDAGPPFAPPSPPIVPPPPWSRPWQPGERPEGVWTGFSTQPHPGVPLTPPADSPTSAP